MPKAVATGTTIERYRVEAVIGAGSMGDVYRGIDIDLKRKVAIKILSERHRDNRELRARFVREARAVAAISHPNVVQVFTTGTFDGRPYIAMEFLDGIDLGTSVAKDGPWDSAAAIRAIRDAARGLDAAARAGLIHRDVKPTNLVLLQDGTVKVTDFGLAKPQDPDDEPALTAMGVVVGTPDYIAPEQARGERIDHRVDIYALGGTLYFLIAGVPPFRTGKPGEDKYLKVVARHLRNPPPNARKRNPTADAELAALAQTMMAKKPNRRPTYETLISQLEAMLPRVERESPTVRGTGMPAPSDGSGGKNSKTPLVGGHGDEGGQRALSDSLAALSELDSAELSGPKTIVDPVPVHPLSGQGAGRAASQGAGRAASQGAGRAASQRARRAPAPPESAQPTELVKSQRARSGAGNPVWLKVLTAIAVLVFFVGAVLTILGPRGLALLPLTSHASPPAARDGDPPAAPAPPQAPAGMILISRSDGTPWLFVSARAVTPADYAAIFPDHEPAKQEPSTAPVTAVSFEYAQAFARSHGKRLATADEWRAASRVDGFERAGGLWEWIEDDARKPDQHTTIHPEQGLAARAGGNASDVTFRLAKDL